jgi:hypothetical protein
MPKTVDIPSALIPELEAWGKLTAKVFGDLRRQSGLIPKGVPKDQEWYWSKQWQAWEREADEDIATGRIQGFDNAEDLIATLNS